MKKCKEDSHKPYEIQAYVDDMLTELSKMAQTSGLEDLASLLRATQVAAAIEIKTEGKEPRVRRAQ